MRCLACDKRLTNSESTRKYASSGTFVDLCNRCFAFVADDIPDVDGFEAEQFNEDEDGTNNDLSELGEYESNTSGGRYDE